MVYIDSHRRQGAFLANQLHRLVDLIAEQGDELLLAAGLSLPSQAVSSVMLIGEHGQISAADIAKRLEQPHQLVTQRIDKLMELGLVGRVNDPRDGRRKILKLTRKGRKEWRLLDDCLSDAEQAFQNLYQEIECDLSAVTRRAVKALTSESIAERMAIA